MTPMALAGLPESQPDTQPVTQPLDESDSACSSEDITFTPPHYWGRLYPATRGVTVRDLTEKETVIGKTSSCNITLTEDEVNQSIWNVFSKKHFKITRTVSSSDPMLNIKVELTDLSLNGTFVNNIRVSKGKTVQLHNDDVIAVAKAEFKVFVFMESNRPTIEHPSIHKQYALSKRLGMGSYGEVKLIFSKETGIGYAMKCIKKTRFLNQDQKMEVEIKILKKISHPNVIKLIEDRDSPSYRYLILQYMEGGDLCERITKNRYLPEAQAKLYFSQIVSGMIYLHDKKIVHRDLKPENVLLASSDVDTVVKITDFGLSKILETVCIMQTLCGTKLYVAPEVLEAGPNEPYTGKVDVWSLGVILYVCLSGKTPFTPTEDKSIEDLVKEAKYEFNDARWRYVSRKARNLIGRMMTKDPDARISMADLKKCSWLRDKDTETKVEELVKAFGEVEIETQVNKENKRLLSASSEEFCLPPKRPKFERMDFL